LSNCGTETVGALGWPGGLLPVGSGPRWGGSAIDADRRCGWCCRPRNAVGAVVRVSGSVPARYRHSEPCPRPLTIGRSPGHSTAAVAGWLPSLLCCVNVTPAKHPRKVSADAIISRGFRYLTGAGVVVSVKYHMSRHRTGGHSVVITESFCMSSCSQHQAGCAHTMLEGQPSHVQPPGLAPS
jgi:hypothetical protein